MLIFVSIYLNRVLCIMTTPFPIRLHAVEKKINSFTDLASAIKKYRNLYITQRCGIC